MKKMLTHKWLLDWKTLYTIFCNIGYIVLSQSVTTEDIRHTTAYKTRTVSMVVSQQSISWAISILNDFLVKM